MTPSTPSPSTQSASHATADRGGAPATDARIAALRAEMGARGLAAVIVPSADPHLSEYLPARWQGRQWLSGFTGSVGTLVVTADFAGVWVDSRYWVQADAQLTGTCVSLMKIAAVGIPGHIDWLAANLPAGARVAVDGQVLSLGAFQALQAALGPRGVVLDIGQDVLDAVWPGRPGLPEGKVYEHLAPHACVTRAEKLRGVRDAMRARQAGAHLISTLDDIAWLFNLRGADVDYNPVFVAHALVRETDATLFVAPGKVDAALQAVLQADAVAVRPYTELPAALAALEQDAAVLVDPARVTVGVLAALPSGVRRIEAINPSTLAKSRKTDAELAHVRAAMEQDGAALCEFFAWLETALAAGETVTELTVDEVLSAARARKPGFVSLSFGTIAGFNANGAMPHYRATAQSHATIAGDGLLLIDSGAQYVGGTTDITRVVAVGAPSAEQKRDCTLVLKGMIALSRARFPRGVLSPMLDAIARAPIWAGGAEYGHGTGHGVGYFMNVHEGPQVISHRAPAGPHTAMEPGMITSNEPGLYRPGRWGVRIENLVCNRPWQTTELGEFLAFETLTLCPIDTRCIDRALLGADEAEWLDAYHAEVRERLLPHVEGAARAWLVRATQPLAQAQA
ncbi:aminopeptidase P family protein [Achromobacter aloeverae]|uniref:Xaa-Pro aminopeptidase n=1 Tax=Achromobacter aloeverae TaxID=1750518 RepID=A0A4Q1HQH1_9BURK|nr:aminopeptidase P family protein [Achromobacter aloeverae]RXN93107.1 Xaa-Pro aminopeptidase [Achromobacter aloeverae]